MAYEPIIHTNEAKEAFRTGSYLPTKEHFTKAEKERLLKILAHFESDIIPESPFSSRDAAALFKVQDSDLMSRRDVENLTVLEKDQLLNILSIPRFAISKNEATLDVPNAGASGAHTKYRNSEWAELSFDAACGSPSGGTSLSNVRWTSSVQYRAGSLMSVDLTVDKELLERLETCEFIDLNILLFVEREKGKTLLALNEVRGFFNQKGAFREATKWEAKLGDLFYSLDGRTYTEIANYDRLLLSGGLK